LTAPISALSEPSQFAAKISAPPLTRRPRASSRAKCRSAWVSDIAWLPGRMLARSLSGSGCVAI